MTVSLASGPIAFLHELTWDDLPDAGVWAALAGHRAAARQLTSTRVELSLA